MTGSGACLFETPRLHLPHSRFYLLTAPRHPGAGVLQHRRLRAGSTPQPYRTAIAVTQLRPRPLLRPMHRRRRPGRARRAATRTRTSRAPTQRRRRTMRALPRAWTRLARPAARAPRRAAPPWTARTSRSSCSSARPCLNPTRRQSCHCVLPAHALAPSAAGAGGSQACLSSPGCPLVQLVSGRLLGAWLAGAPCDLAMMPGGRQMAVSTLRESAPRKMSRPHALAGTRACSPSASARSRRGPAATRSSAACAGTCAPRLSSWLSWMPWPAERA